MVTVYFGKTVKYKGITYLPNTKFEVEDSDIDSLKLQGAWVVEEENKKETPKKKEIEINYDIIESTKDSKLYLLREEAKKLGVEYSDGWGVKRLQTEIKKVSK